MRRWIVTPQRVNEARAIATWAMRGTAALLMLLGCYLVLKRLAFGVSTGEAARAWDLYLQVGEEHSFSRGVAMLIVGAALAAVSSRLGRWVVATPAEGCPRCGYEVGTAAAPESRCPECGLPGAHVEQGQKEHG